MIIKIISHSREKITSSMANQNENIKNFSDAVSTIKSDNTITNITRCLTDDHKECTGKYVDSITGNFLIICLCECHHNRKHNTIPR